MREEKEADFQKKHDIICKNNKIFIFFRLSHIDKNGCIIYT